jgi:hypothetical protein
MNDRLVNPHDRRPSGSPPYWKTGTQILWRSGDGHLATAPPAADSFKAPQFAEPVTVVRDDRDGLVAWLAAGTPIRQVARVDGLDKRADKGSLFTADIEQEVGVWKDYDVLRVTPTGQPWSMWLFFAEQTKAFAGWYVNLEEPHVRDRHAIYTHDHVLDIVIEPDHTASRKDEDELSLAVEQGRFDARTAERIVADAAAVESIIAVWGAPFKDGWETFRPDPGWPIPRLPSEECVPTEVVVLAGGCS